MSPKRLLPVFLLLTALTLTTLLLTRAASPLTIKILDSQFTILPPPTSSPSPHPAGPPPDPLHLPQTHETDTLYAGLGIDTYFDWGIVNASDTPITVPTTT